MDNYANLPWVANIWRECCNLVVGYVCISSCCCKSIVLGMGYQKMVENTKDRGPYSIQLVVKNSSPCYVTMGYDY